MNYFFLCEYIGVLTRAGSVAAGLVDLVGTPVHVGTGALTGALQTTEQHRESNEPQTKGNRHSQNLGL